MSTVSVIVPAYNEGAELGANLVTLAEQFAHYSCYEVQFVLVNDGSTDQTAESLAAFSRFRRGVTVVTHERNLGLGAALRSGFAHATGDYSIVVDADLSYTPAVAMQLLEAIERTGSDIVLASPYIRGGSVNNVPCVRRILSREANRFLSLATKGQYATLTCMVRAYRTRAVRTLAFKSDGMEANAEILLLAVRNNFAIVEIPARLEWTADRRSSRGRLSLAKTARRTIVTTRLGLSHRPALWLALPGLVPGSWPLVVGILLLFHATPAQLALGSIAILTVQYTSLAIFAGQLGHFFTRGFLSSRQKRSNAIRL